MSSHLTFTPISGAMGAVIHGLDTTRLLAEADIDDLRAALDTYQLLLINQIGVDLTDFARLIGHFGALDDYPHASMRPLSQVHTIDSRDEEANYNGKWHADGFYYGKLLKVIALQADVAPAFGGDTLWTSLYTAYDALSPQLKTLLDGLTIEYDFAPYLSRLANKRYLQIMQEHLKLPLTMPIVCTFGSRKSLFFYPDCARFVHGIPDNEGQWLIDFLTTHISRHEFVYRHRWQRGDIVIWDNRTTLHKAIYDFEGHRKLHRITVS